MTARPGHPEDIRIKKRSGKKREREIEVEEMRETGDEETPEVDEMQKDAPELDESDIQKEGAQDDIAQPLPVLF